MTTKYNTLLTSDPDKVYILDIETQGLTPGADLIEIAVANLSGEVLFHRMYDINPDRWEIGTYQWYTSKNLDAARASFPKSTDIYGDMDKLAELLATADLLYCYGASFDFPMLDYDFDWVLPHYHKLRCLRTLAVDLGIDTTFEFHEGEVPHLAFYDVQAEARLLAKVKSALTNVVV